ncbi:MAG: stage II sporulation protein M [Anaerolineales bacterium]|nr:MAG: stage II sporulation protein M [Anaerolineales bacterium]
MIERLGWNIAPALIITRREVRDQFRDWRIIFPVVVLTIFFPGLMNFTASQVLGFVERYGASIVGDRLIPFLLMIVGFFPISVSLVIALESFVGEKERRSIEPLLSSPLTDSQLYFGKLLAAMVPPLLASFLGISVYLIGIYMQVGWKPEPALLLQIILLTIVQALVMVSGAVVVSSQTTSVRAANLLASFIIIPMALLIQGESIVMFWGQYSALWYIILGQVVIAGLLVRTGISHFNREELLGRELDILNLRWGWRVFKRAFIGQADSVVTWFVHELPATLKKVRLPFTSMVLAVALGLWIGGQQAKIFVLPENLLNFGGLNAGTIESIDFLQFFSITSVGAIWLHNIRAILIASVLGLFSFGVLGIIILMLPFILIGYIMMNVATVGVQPLTFLTALILPHGILEIPAIMLAGASILIVGATLASPAQGRSIGEAWLAALADWTKLMLGLVLPFLLGAAVLEVFVTPRIAIWLLGG